MKYRLLICLLALGFGLGSRPCAAHQPSDSYLQLESTANTLDGRWDISLIDLELALGLDEDEDGDLTWGEVRRRHDDISSYAFAHLSLLRGGEACQLTATEQAIDRHSEAPYNVLFFTGQCPVTGPIEGHYSLFFDLDPSHRGMLRLGSGTADQETGASETASHGTISHTMVQSTVLSPQSPRFYLDGSAPPSHRETMRAYVGEGVIHIWGGLDHILFLLTLLLPAVLMRSDNRWLGVASFRQAAIEVVKIVTAFTVAHSVTLALAVLGWVSLPSRFVESTIALTVVLAALNNLRPVVRGKVWGLALVLGLIHGFGFAGVLADLDLPSGPLAVALASFNIGVEAGQLAIVAVFLPIAFLLRKTWVYQRVICVGGSLAVASIAVFWLWERSFMVP